MIGYFFDGSKLVGLNIMPYRSVLPSRPFTVNGIGGTQPVAFSRVMSAVATSASLRPSSALRSTVTGGVVGVEYASTKALPSGDSVIVWSAASGVSSTGLPPSRLPLKNCWEYGFTPAVRPTPRNHTVRVFGSTLSTSVTLPSPLVIACLSLPVFRSYRKRLPQLFRSLNQIASLVSGR